MTNTEIADKLEEVADLLEQDPKTNPFRVSAYRDGAATIRGLDEPAEAIIRRGGKEALESLEGIGSGLAGAIAELVETGRLGTLERLREETSPEVAFGDLPGVGDQLAERIYRTLGVSTLPELEEAAAEGRLREVRGIGPTLERQIVEALNARLGRRARRASPEEPPIAELLDVDREYREKATAGRLRTIAPKRFNPEAEEWLPVLETRRGERRYSALFSNTAQAHRLGRVRDWVVLYYASPGRQEKQVTVVTATDGPLRGKRVVRGREQECREYYEGARSQARAA